ncbi:Cof-type HAD-IIB family hydrolase [Heyndrickxia acidiproducens]|uniref:Cof-type HAD-IIB family hydrolase n=1 Tax=Heyndrickxia acidiproducens TaxID=1121084 RepID=UPI000370B0F2|nr:Cof-type HAD-IIB family hydrolase [Heyndrickxia acidiproducens]
MGIKAVFSDIDGTLLNSSHQISPETKRAVQMCVEKGVPFVLVSARMPSGVAPLQKELGIMSPMICYSGALVLGKPEKNGTRPELYSKGPSDHDACRLYKLVHTDFPGISFNVYHEDQWIVEDLQNEWVVQEQAITGVVPLEKQLDAYLKEGQPIHKILCMGQPGEISRLEEKLTDYFPNLSIYKSKDTYLEMMDKTVSKSAAILNLMSQLGISRHEIMALGDNFNDRDMLEFAGIGVAMGNAPAQVKEKADEVTSTNDEDGVRHSLEKHILKPGHL